MKYAVTIVQQAPAEGNKDAILPHTIVVNSMLEALKRVEDAELNFTLFVNVTITPLRGFIHVE